MLKAKHLFDSVEASDGERIWIEPIALTRDLREWCRIDSIMNHLGPSMELFDWLEAHPSGFDFFQDQYEMELKASAYRVAMRGLAFASRYRDYTLVHQGADPKANSATALLAHLRGLADAAAPLANDLLRKRTVE